MIRKNCFPGSNALAYFAQTFYSPEEGFLLKLFRCFELFLKNDEDNYFDGCDDSQAEFSVKTLDIENRFFGLGSIP